jgi:hypothetical protein
MLVLIGSDHFDKEYQTKINNIIRKSHPKTVLHELMNDDIVTTSKKAKTRIVECDEDSECDPRYNKKLYQLITKMVGFTKFYGIAPDFKKHTKKPLEFIKQLKWFRMRERTITAEIVDRMSKTSYTHLTIAVVQDKHLRNDSDGDHYTQAHGWSFLVRKLAQKRIPFVIIRKKQVNKESVHDLVDTIKYMDTAKYL